jgi:repressor LexA
MTGSPRPLKPRQQAILVAIREYQAEHGWAPTIRELAEATGYQWTSVVEYHLRRLEEYGYLVRLERSARTMRVTGAGEAAMEAEVPATA